MKVCIKSKANTEIQFDIKKFIIALMAIFVTLLCSLQIVCKKRVTVKKQKNLCGKSVKTNIVCIYRKLFAYHLKSFRVPAVVRVPQVGNPYRLNKSNHLEESFCDIANAYCRKSFQEMKSFFKTVV